MNVKQIKHLPGWNVRRSVDKVHTSSQIAQRCLFLVAKFSSEYHLISLAFQELIMN